MRPARTMSLCDSASASAGSSRRVGRKSWERRDMGGQPTGATPVRASAQQPSQRAVGAGCNRMFIQERTEVGSMDDAMRMPGVLRFGLVVLGLPQLAIGAWALASPSGWFDTFPGAGHHWLPAYGPYNSHLATDVGATF